MGGDDEVFAAAEQWLKWDQYPESKSVVEDLLNGARANDKSKLDELRKAFASRQVFGTAGIRGKMEPGTANMNDLVIVQTCQGLYDYVKGVFPDLSERGIVVGHDARHNSKRWAHRTAAIFMHKGVPVYLFNEVVPTPFVAFSVALFKACCGVMVTASHNPKADNGYKVYWENSAQILSPHDKNIQQHIVQNQEPWPNSWDLSIVEKGGSLLHDPLPEVEKNYYKALVDSMLDIEGNRQTNVKFTFTPLHGVSQKMMERAFEHCGFPPFVSVPEQKDPNPDFPTAPFPNPEEGKTALDCAIKAADTNGCKYIIANDPDADRMAVAEKIDGSWRMFNGNETGCLLSYWIWHCFKNKNPTVDSKDVYMISTAVSSKFILALANKEGFNFVETLTGFKWMGNRADELLKQGKHVLYAYEEAIGHMCMIPPLDKDGVSAAVKIAEFISHADRVEGKTLQQKLEDLYRAYGYHKATTSYYLSYDPAVTKQIFTRIRNFDNGKPFTYPLKLGDMPIRDVRDLTVGYDSTKPDKKPTLPVSSSTEMITFYLDNGCIVTLRTSGTEPKIKYYMEMRSKPEETNWKAMDEVLMAVEEAIVKECLQPEINNLKPRIGS